MDYSAQLQSVIEALRLVAAPASIQISALPNFVYVIDEIMGTYYNAYLLVPQLCEQGLIDEDALSELTRLDDWFEARPKDESICTLESLETHPFWQRARELAKGALNTLGQEDRPPDLSHIFYLEEN